MAGSFGISGGSYSTASAYIADVSTDENRAKNFGLLGIAFGIGFILGPIIGGFLGEFGPRIPFFGAALISFLNFVAAYFLLPETLAAKDRRTFEWKRVQSARRAETDAQSQGNSVDRAGVLHADARPHVLSGGMGLCRQLSLWLERKRYRHVARHLRSVQRHRDGLVLPRIVSRFGEWRTAVIGLAFAALGFFGYASAWQGWLVYVVIIATCLEGVADPAMRSIASAKVPASEQGELQGAMTSLFSITNIIGPLIFTQIFAIFTAPNASITFSGAPYVLGGIFVLIGLIVFILRVEKPSLAKDEVLVPGALAQNEAG